MAALLHLNSSNYGQALAALHSAILAFDEYTGIDFAEMDRRLTERFHANSKQQRRRKKRKK